MGDFIIQLGILDPLYFAFGWLTRVLFEFFGNYGVAIIMLTVIIRGALIPLNVSSQKSMIKMQALSGKQAELQRKYGNDKEKYQEALMQMQKENGAGGMGGCLLPFLQLFFIWPIFRIVEGPLVYISQVSKDNVKAMVELGKTFGDGSLVKAVSDINHIGLVKALTENAQFLNECVSRGFIKLEQLIDMHFLGFDLSMVPQWNPMVIAQDPGKYIPYLILPVLVIITSVIPMQMTKFMKPGYKEEKEAKKRAKQNPAREGQAGVEDATAQSMKMMNWMMPAIMVWTTFTMPAAMSLYWIVGGIMQIISQLIVYYLFTKPYEEKKAELEAKKDAVFKKSARTALAAATSGEENSSENSSNKGKNKKKK